MTSPSALRDDSPSTVTLGSVGDLLRRRSRVFAAVVIGAIAAAVVSLVYYQPPYEARALLQVQTASSGSLEHVQFDLGYADRLLNTYAQLAASERFREQLPLPPPVRERLQIDVRVPANTELIEFVVAHEDQASAAEAANTVAEIIAEQMREHVAQRYDAAAEALLEEAELAEDPGQAISAYNQLVAQRAASISGIEIVEPAQPSEDRGGLSQAILAGIILTLGILGAFVGALLVERLDPTVSDVGTWLRKRGFSLLGNVPVTLDRNALRSADGRSPATIRPQAVSVGYRIRAQGPRSILLTPAVRSRGATLMVAHLARALASTGSDVVVLDAARRPDLRQALGVPPQSPRTSQRTQAFAPPGRQAAVRPALDAEQVERNLHLVTMDASTTMLADLAEVMEHLKHDYRLVLVHTPPVLEWAEASLLSKLTDGAVLLVEEAQVSEQDLEESTHHIAALPCAFLGVVVAQDGRRGGRRGRRTVRSRQP